MQEPKVLGGRRLPCRSPFDDGQNGFYLEKCAEKYRSVAVLCNDLSKFSPLLEKGQRML
ncbi:hypothetical protein ACFLZU_00385 [Thermodesulfobacteriota bacterium]